MLGGESTTINYHRPIRGPFCIKTGLRSSWGSKCGAVGYRTLIANGESNTQASHGWDLDGACVRLGLGFGRLMTAAVGYTSHLLLGQSITPINEVLKSGAPLPKAKRVGPATEGASLRELLMRSREGQKCLSATSPRL